MFKDSIKLLGVHGSKGISHQTTCIQLGKNTVIDAGNIICGLGDDAKYIDNIFLTHTHLDHIVDIPFFIDAFFNQRVGPLKIYSLEKNLEILKTNMFNWDIWPDFTNLCLPEQKAKAIELIPIKIGDKIKIDEYTNIEPISNNHTTSSCGYIVTKSNNSLLFTSDTHKCQSIWDRVNCDLSIKTVIIDVSFPNALNTLAQSSKHLTPSFLKDELKKLKRDDVDIIINHLKPTFIENILSEIDELKKDIDIKITLAKQADIVKI